MRRQADALIAMLDCRWPAWVAVIVAALALLAFILRVHDLGRWDLTFDEAASIWIARKPPPDMIRYLLGAFHEHPPSYYLSLWAWTQLAGQSEFVLRFWSVLAGVLSVPLIYIWLRRLIGRGTGLIGALLLALSPFHIYYSQDVRMYPLVGMLALLSLIFFDRILSTPATTAVLSGTQRSEAQAKDADAQFREARRWWIGWAAVTLIGLSTHYFMGLVNAAQTVFLFITWRRAAHRRVLKAWLAIHFGVAALIGLWILASPGLQTTLGNLWASGGPSRELIRTLRVLSFEVIFGPVSRLGHEWLWAMLILAAVGLMTAIGSRRTMARAGAGWLIGALIVVPPLGVLLTPEALASRYVLFVVFGYLAAAAIALTQAARQLPWLGIALTLIVVWTGVSRYEHQYATPKSVYGEDVDRVRSNWQPGDVLILNGPWQWVQLDYYRPGDVPMFYLPPHTPPPLDPVETRPILESIARDYRRIWVIQAAVKSADPDGFVVRWLNQTAYAAEARGDVLLYYTRTGAARVQPVNVTVGDALDLREAVLPDGAVESGDALLTGLRWSVRRAPGADLVASLALVGLDGSVWAERVYRPGEAFAPPAMWRDGQEVIDRQALPIPIGTPPGEYALRLNIRRADSGTALIPAGADNDPWITLANVGVTAPAAVRATAVPGRPLDVVFGGGLRLVSVALAGDRFSQGAWLGFELYWSADGVLDDDLAADIALIDSHGRAIAQATQPIAPDAYPTSMWGVGQIVKSRHLIYVPPRAPGGRYTIRIGIVGRDGSNQGASGRVRHAGLFGLGAYESVETGSSWAIDAVTVEELPRQFALPSPQHRVDARFGDRFQLLGYDLPAEPAWPGEPLRLTVYWQALQSIDADFTTFTHLVGPDGSLAGQSDHWPRNWTYPTSFWVGGEVVADEYLVPIDAAAAPGAYALLVGWYDSDSGERLPVVDAGGQALASNQFLLGTVEFLRP